MGLMMVKCKACTLYWLIAWSCLVWGLAVAMIVVGVWVHMDRHSGRFEDGVSPSSLAEGDSGPVVQVTFLQVVNRDQVLTVLPATLLTMGACAVLFTLMGFAGAVCQQRVVLMVCFALQLLVFVTAVGVAVYLYIEKDQIDVDKGKLFPLLADALKTAVDAYHSEHQSKLFMEDVQNRLKCCGASNGGGDYAPILDLPCEMNLASIPCTPLYQDAIAQKIGLKEFFHEKIDIGFALSACMAAVLIVLQILTLFVCCALGRNEDG